jgi:hypothetical protein
VDADEQHTDLLLVHFYLLLLPLAEPQTKRLAAS